MNELPPEVNRYVDLLLSHGSLWIYLAVALAMIFEYIIPPVPGDVAIFAAGFLAGTERSSLTIILISAFIGSCIGLSLVYFVGERYGRRLLENRNFWFINNNTLKRTEQWYKKIGGKLLLVSKFMPGIRFALVFFSGIAKMPFKRVFLYTAISCIVWNSMVILLAFNLQKHIESVYRILSTYNVAALILVMALVVLWALRFFMKKRSKA